MASSFSFALVYKGPTTAPMTDTDMPSSPGSDKYARQDGDDDETYELLLQLKELRCARLQALIDLKEVRGRAADFYSLYSHADCFFKICSHRRESRRHASARRD